MNVMMYEHCTQGNAGIQQTTRHTNQRT